MKMFLSKPDGAFLVLCFFFLVFAYKSGAILSGDNNYRVLEAPDKSFRIIFDRQYESSIDWFYQKIKTRLLSHSRFKNHHLDEPLTVLLISSQFQEANAYATMLPSNIIVMLPSVGLNSLSPFSFERVFEHELNHVFQLSSHFKKMGWLKRILPFSLFAYPYNGILFTPRFVIEGDSVLKESLFPYGEGRLFNGRWRALVYAQIAHYQHRREKFKNHILLQPHHRTAHSHMSKYAHGAYFMAMLAHYYSHSTLNSFFDANKKRLSYRLFRQVLKEAKKQNHPTPQLGEYLNFRYLNFQYQLMSLLTEFYFNHYLEEAGRQKSSSRPGLFTSQVCLPFNQSEDEIFFLTSDHSRPPLLRILNKSTGKWTQKSIDLPLGKVFRLQGAYHSGSSQITAPYTRQYSLFSEGYYNIPEFNSRYVQDLHNNNMLYIKADNTLKSVRLYWNRNFYSDIHSNALFDSRGNIYYFKQQNQKRTLYKNKKAVFSYTGYEGSLLEVDKKGVVFFTAPSPYGSSVYRYEQGRIFRSTSSDRVFQAQKINSRELLICELSPYEYEYKIVPLKTLKEKPALYSYTFKKRKPHQEVSVLKTSLNSPASPSTQKHRFLPQKQASPRRKTSQEVSYQTYRPFQNIYLNTCLWAATLTHQGLWFSGCGFSDYLLKHHVSLVYFVPSMPYMNFKKAQAHNIMALYGNTVHPLNFNLGYSFYVTPKNKTAGAAAGEPFLTQTAFLSFSYPLWKRGHWFSHLHSHNSGIFKTGSTLQNQPLRHGLESLSFTGEWIFSYSQSFPFNIYKKWTGYVFFDHLRKTNEHGTKWGGGYELTIPLSKGFYASSGGMYEVALAPSVHPAGFQSPKASLAFLKTSKKPYLRQKKTYATEPSEATFFTDTFSDLFTSSVYESTSVLSMDLKFTALIDTSTRTRIRPFIRLRWRGFEDLLLSPSQEQKNYSIFNRQGYKKPGNTTVTSAVAKNLMGVSRLIPKQEHKEEKKTKIHKGLTQWLEWSFGFNHTTFIVFNEIPLTYGLSLGFKTPVFSRNLRHRIFANAPLPEAASWADYLAKSFSFKVYGTLLY